MKLIIPIEISIWPIIEKILCREIIIIGNRSLKCIELGTAAASKITTGGKRSASFLKLRLII